MCLQLANLQQKSFPNKWTNAVMRKFTRANIASPSDLKYYIVSEMLNPRLITAGDSGLHPTTQKGFLVLLNGNQDFVRGGAEEFVLNALLSTTNSLIVY